MFGSYDLYYMNWVNRTLIGTPVTAQSEKAILRQKSQSRSQGIWPVAIRKDIISWVCMSIEQRRTDIWNMEFPSLNHSKDKTTLKTDNRKTDKKTDRTKKICPIYPSGDKRYLHILVSSDSTWKQKDKINWQISRLKCIFYNITKMIHKRSSLSLTFRLSSNK